LAFLDFTHEVKVLGPLRLGDYWARWEVVALSDEVAK
jgi:hypothetical protein